MKADWSCVTEHEICDLMKHMREALLSTSVPPFSTEISWSRKLIEFWINELLRLGFLPSKTLKLDSTNRIVKMSSDNPRGFSQTIFFRVVKRFKCVLKIKCNEEKQAIRNKPRTEVKNMISSKQNRESGYNIVRSEVGHVFQYSTRRVCSEGFPKNRDRKSCTRRISRSLVLIFLSYASKTIL